MPNGVFLNILVVSQFKLPNFTLAFFFWSIKEALYRILWTIFLILKFQDINFHKHVGVL